MKKVVIAPDSFKGTLSSVEVCGIVEDALKEKYPDIDCVKLPVADGGEGTSEAFLYALGGQKVEVKVTDPIGRKINACYVLVDDMAVIETAAASGITLLKEMSPLEATTFGTGELILDALDRGKRKIVIGLGGSATTDAGTGCLTALGAKFLTSQGEKVISGGKLSEIAHIDMSGLDERLSDCEITVLCDVTNPLYGENGAAYVFSPQKGADKEQVKLLDSGLKHIALLTAEKLGRNNSDTAGAGAAGGLGFAFHSYLPSKFRSGARAVLDICRFSEKIKGADMVITGEGKMDKQSLMGKVPFIVAEMSDNIPVTAIVGVSEISENEAKAYGISRIIETNPNRLPFEEVKRHCKKQLADAAKKL